MSSNKDLTHDLNKEVEAEIAISQKKKELERAKIERQHNEFLKRKKELEALQELDVTKISDEEIEQMDLEHDLMLKSMSNKLPFINKDLTDIVPFSYPNLLFLGGKSGEGKSTTAANIVYSLISTGKRVLVLSNEEMATSYYNRIACLHSKLNVNDIQNFTEDQHKLLKKYRAAFARQGYLRVIDPNYKKVEGATNSLEGVQMILENLYAKYVKTGITDYDAIILDYYQKVNASKEDPQMAEWMVLKKLSEFLDDFYKRYPAPLVVLGQLHPSKKEKDGEEVESFENRIKGGRNIYVVSTFAMEIIPNKKDRTSNFCVRKHRWSDLVDSGVVCGWEKGRFVSYTPEFRNAVATEKVEKELLETTRLLKIGKQKDSE